MSPNWPASQGPQERWNGNPVLDPALLQQIISLMGASGVMAPGAGGSPNWPHSGTPALPANPNFPAPSGPLYNGAPVLPDIRSQLMQALMGNSGKTGGTPSNVSAFGDTPMGGTPFNGQPILPDLNALIASSLQSMPSGGAPPADMAAAMEVFRQTLSTAQGSPVGGPQGLSTPLTSPLAPPVQQGPQAPLPMWTGDAPFDEPQLGMESQDKSASWGNVFGNKDPLYRGDLNNPMQNILAGTGNWLWNAPGAAASTVGNVAGAGIDATANMWKWLTTPEGEFNAEKAAEAEAAKGPPGRTFQPGLPGSNPTGAAPGGTPSVVDQITQVESGGDPNADNPNSSALGTGQFLDDTWLEFMREVHPDQLEQLGRTGALELRRQPALNDEATAWYAGKGMDVLDSIGAPATDTNLYLHHFLGPGGVQKLLTADPGASAESVLGLAVVGANKSVLEGKTVQEVKDWAAAKMGDYEAGGPTLLPSPTMPDFSEANRWYEEAAPKEVDPQLLKEVMFADMLAGIGAGLGSVDASREGGGALFGALAAGTTAGLASGKQKQLELTQEFENQMNAYAGNRGDIATGQAQTLASHTDAVAQTNALNEQAKKDYLTAEDAKVDALTTPKILNASADGLWVQTGTEVQFIPSDVNKKFEDIEKMAETFGLDSMVARQTKYSLMSQMPEMNLLSYQQEVMKDLVVDGLGPSVFGPAYEEAITVAMQQMPGTLLPGTPESQEWLNRTLVGLLMGAMQQNGNTDWLLQAAAQGNPGAIILTQNGQFIEPEAVPQ